MTKYIIAHELKTGTVNYLKGYYAFGGRAGRDYTIRRDKAMLFDTRKEAESNLSNNDKIQQL